MFPNVGEIWYRYDHDNREEKFVVVTAINGATIFAQYVSNVADSGTFYPTFARTLSDFTNIFTKQDGSWV